MSYLLNLRGCVIHSEEIYIGIKLIKNFQGRVCIIPDKLLLDKNDLYFILADKCSVRIPIHQFGMILSVVQMICPEISGYEIVLQQQLNMESLFDAKRNKALNGNIISLRKSNQFK